MSSAKVRYLKINFNQVLEKLKEYAVSKSLSHGTRAVVLTGSLAKGTYTGTSDVDILIIADEVPANVLERFGLFAETDFPIDLEPRIYTSEEFIRKVREGDRFATETLRVGIPVYGDQFFEDLRRDLGTISQVARKFSR